MAYCLSLMDYRRKQIYLSLAVCFLCVNLLGCAGLKERAKGFLGISTKALEEVRKEAIGETFNCDYFTCYTKTLDALKSMGSHIYTKDIKRHMIAIYVSEQDTTPVGIFFKEIEKNSTQVEVSSTSTYAKELTSLTLFPRLRKSIEQE